MVVRKRLDISGPAMAYVTTTVKDWRPVFSDKERASLILKQLQETLVYHRVSLVAYVLMPSHLHTLLGFRAIEDLSEVIQGFKSLSSKRIRPLMPMIDFPDFYDGDKFQFWKPRFDDLIIWSKEQFKTKIDYIHNNPAKAGLVASAEEYEFSSAVDWLKGVSGGLVIDKNWTWTDGN